MVQLNVSAQSSLGILGKAAGQLLEGTSKKSEWQVVGKVLQTAGDMQYNLDKTKIENERTYNYNINTSNNQGATGNSKTNIPEHVVIRNEQYHPEDGYVWVNTFDRNDLSVKKVDLSIDEKVEELNNKAENALDNGRISESIIYSTQSINLKPNWEAFFWRILSNYTLKNYDNSLGDLDLILNYFSDEYYDIQFLVFFELRGLMNNELGNYEKALFNYNKALEIECSPDFDCNTIKAEILTNRANSKFALKDFDGAIDDCDKAAEIDPASNKSSILNMKGLICMQKEDWNNALYYFNEAINSFNQSVVDKGQLPVLHTNKAAVEYALNDYRSSMVDANKAIEYDAKYSKAFYIRGLSKVELGITESACSDFKKALEFGFEGANEMITKHCK